ncbi:MAG: GYF domain-containing protein [Verrucomicrobiota bacterium]
MANPNDLPPNDPPEAGVPRAPRIRLKVHTPPTEPVESPGETGPQYYLSRDGEPVGPFSRAQLDSMFGASDANPEELAWREGMPDWRPLRELLDGVDGSRNPSASAPPGNESVGRNQDGFRSLLWGSLSYPFRGDGVILLVVGTLFFAFLGLLTRYGTLFAWIPSLMAGGYFLATLQGIVQSTGAGDASPPTWPDITNWVGDLVAPCLKWLVSLAVAFGPAILCFEMASSMDGGLPDSGELASREQALWLGAALGLFLLGVVYFPMAILGVAMSDSLGALSPAFVVRSIAAVPGSYAAVVTMMLVLLFLRSVVDALMRRVPVPLVEHFTGAFISLYFGFVQARILGVLYRSHRERLGWF